MREFVFMPITGIHVFALMISVIPLIPFFGVENRWFDRIKRVWITIGPHVVLLALVVFGSGTWARFWFGIALATMVAVEIYVQVLGLLELRRARNRAS